MEATSKVMLLALCENEISLLRRALQELVREVPPHADTASQLHHLLGKLPNDGVPPLVASEGSSAG